MPYSQHPEAAGYRAPSLIRTYSNNLMWFGLGVAMTVLMGLARPNGAQERRAVAPPAKAGHPKKAISPAPARPVHPARLPAQSGGKDAEGGPTIEPDSARRPLSYYTKEVRQNLFSAPQPPPPPKPKPKPKPAPKPPPRVIVPVAPINPFADWSYTGTVKMGDKTMALLENVKTKEGKYVAVGDSFMGATVGSVTDQTVTLQSGGKPTLLARSDNITVTPLDKSAGFLGGGGGPSGNPAPGGPPSPGGPPQGGPPPGIAPGATVFSPNGNVVIQGQFPRRRVMRSK